MIRFFRSAGPVWILFTAVAVLLSLAGCSSTTIEAPEGELFSAVRPLERAQDPDLLPPADWSELSSPAVGRLSEAGGDSDRVLPGGEDAEDWISWYDERYGPGSASTVIEDEATILLQNQERLEKCPTLTDLRETVDSFDRETVLEMITRYRIPEGDVRGPDGGPVGEEIRTAIRDNLGTEQIPDTVTVRYAVSVRRCDIRSLPSDMPFYRPGDDFYDMIQESELFAGSPVRILHESADGRYLFIQCVNYNGWIPADAVAECDREAFRLFVEPERFVTITSPYVEAGGTRWDMGVLLPLLAEEEGYLVLAPGRGSDGLLSLSVIRIPSTDAVAGFLPYTMENLYRQSIAYLGTVYGWGGAHGGVDCSGFISSVFRTFGILLPRNSDEQSRFNGRPLELDGLSIWEKQMLLDQVSVPATLHQRGHVLLFLGVRDGRCMVIHAPGKSEVRIDVLPQAELIFRAQIID